MKVLIFGFLLFGCSPKPEITKICLEGHIYFNYKDTLALKVDDEGKPIQCLDNKKGVTDKPKKELEKIARSWLKFIDEKDYQESYKAFAGFAKNVVTQKDWAKKMDESSKQTGKIIKRELNNSSIVGIRATIIFNSDFENFPQAKETVSMIKEGEKWLVAGYFVQ